MTDRDRLIELFKKIEYTPFPEMTMKSNLGNQFTDYALNCIVDEILANGVIVPPCNVGDKIYSVFNGEVKELNVISFSLLNSTVGVYQNIHTVNSRGAVVSYELHDFGKTVFLTREEAEKALERKDGAKE